MCFLKVEASGSVLVGGFGDGVLRMFVISLREFQRFKVSQNLRKSSSQSFKKPLEYINIIQVSFKIICPIYFIFIIVYQQNRDNS